MPAMNNTDSVANMIARRDRLLGKAYRLFYDVPLHITRGEGVWLYDADGVKYLDVYNNVPHVGHCHPHVVAALTEQIKTLNTHTRYLHEGVLDYAEMLIAKFPTDLNMAMFACTGSEANELALRIARAHTGGSGFIATEMVTSMKPEALEKLSAMIPLKRMGEPAEIGHTALYVFENDYYTGRIMEMDGGLRL